MYTYVCIYIMYICMCVCACVYVYTLVHTDAPEMCRSKTLNSHSPSHLFFLTYTLYSVYLRFILDLFNCSYTHYLYRYWKKMELNLLITDLKKKKKTHSDCSSETLEKI